MNKRQIYKSDINELKSAEDKLKYALIKVEESEKIKSNFLAQMSHEIRSPLTAILGFNSIIKDELQNKVSDDLNFAFNAVENSGKRLIRTIDQLLNMSQLQAGNYEIMREEFSLFNLVSDLFNEYKNELDTKKIKIIFENKIDGNKIISDKYAVNQILQNILENAIKYTGKGEIKIIIDKDSKNKIYLSISDTGIGMSEEYIQKLFTPFSQEVMGYNRPFEGNGLGLAMCKRYADLNNINIHISSVKNVGSTFTLIFN
ncbi:MAG: sensor histidine kinase [Ignavibacteriaceae bacterium]